MPSSGHPTHLLLECEMLKSKIVPKFLDMVRMAIRMVLINLIVCCIKGDSGLRGSNGQAAKPCEVTRWEQESTTCQAFLILPAPVGEQPHNSWRGAIHLPKDPSCSSHYIYWGATHPSLVGGDPPQSERNPIIVSKETFPWKRGSQ